MVLVKPTARWLGKTQRIPRGRKINRNGVSGAIEVTATEAQYLTGNFFAVVLDEAGLNPPAVLVSTPATGASAETTKAQLTDEELPVETEEPVVSTLVHAPPSEETLVLDYLNATDPEAIARQIKGVGRKTADDLVDSRPLDWEAVQVILSDRQLEAVVEFVKSNVKVGVEIGVTKLSSDT